MNQFLNAFMKLFKAYERGDLGEYPDPEEPGDLDEALTTEEINFVKRLKKEIEERFPVPSCTEEKTSVAITETACDQFTVSWTNPDEFESTIVKYRETGNSEWLTPNEEDAAIGYFLDESTFYFSTFTEDIEYDILVQNVCNNLVISTGVVVTEVATGPLP